MITGSVSTHPGHDKHDANRLSEAMARKAIRVGLRSMRRPASHSPDALAFHVRVSTGALVFGMFLLGGALWMLVAQRIPNGFTADHLLAIAALGAILSVAAALSIVGPLMTRWALFAYEQRQRGIEYGQMADAWGTQGLALRVSRLVMSVGPSLGVGDVTTHALNLMAASTRLAFGGFDTDTDRLLSDQPSLAQTVVMLRQHRERLQELLDASESDSEHQRYLSDLIERLDAIIASDHEVAAGDGVGLHDGQPRQPASADR